MPIVPPKNKVIGRKHETGIEIVNRVHCQSDNDYANPVAASKLPFQKPMNGNSGSAFCYAI